MALDTLEIFGVEYTGVAGIKATDDNDTVKTYIRPQGTLNITSNGTGIDCSSYAEVDVAVPAPPPSPTLETVTKSYTPITSQQTETITPSTGYDGIGEVDVTVAAMPTGSVTVGTSIYSDSSTVTAGTNELRLYKSIQRAPIVTTNGYVTNANIVPQNVGVTLAASVTTLDADNIHPSSTAQYINTGTYIKGQQEIMGVVCTNLDAANIKQGVTVKIGDSMDDDCVTSVLGTYTGSSGSSYAQVGSNSYTVSTTSTSAASVATLTINGVVQQAQSNVMYIRIRDSQGMRSGYFFGSDTYVVYGTGMGSYNLQKFIYTSNNGTSANVVLAQTTGGYGVYPRSVTSTSNSLSIQIYRRYNSSSSLTINGTYIVTVYILNGPNNKSPWVV